MAYRRTFSDYTPSPRTVPEGSWTGVRIYEGLTPVLDDMALIDTKTFTDPSPADPQTRTFTTDQATLPVGWYELVFYNGTQIEPTGPVYYGGALSPSVQEVANLIRARTMGMGGQLNRFDDTTDPTSDQVAEYVATAGSDLVSTVGRDIPSGAWDLFRTVTKIGAALLIEVNSEEINESRYDRLKALYDEQLGRLTEAVREIDSGGDPGAVDDVIGPVAIMGNQGRGVSGWQDWD